MYQDFHNKEAGYIEVEKDEKTSYITQEKIKNVSSLLSASKMFSLEIRKGPYKVRSTENGRNICFSGINGHVGGFDRLTGELLFEREFEDETYDITWLQNNKMFATAQKNFVYIYDQNGVELHRLDHHNPRFLRFLPYHFLLVSVAEFGFLRYQDISTGDLVSERKSDFGLACSMTHNQKNAVVKTGHRNGSVCMWTPNHVLPVVTMKCHYGPVCSMAVDSTGNYLATAGLNKKIKIWDLRTYKQLDQYKAGSMIKSLSISQRGILAVGMLNRVVTWKDVFKTKQDNIYLSHSYGKDYVSSVEFCPFDDVLCVGTNRQVSTILIPGAGEPNFDSMEVNPFENKKQKQELEIKRLVEKIPPDTIGLKPVITTTIKPLKKKQILQLDPIEEASSYVKRKMKKKERKAFIAKMAKKIEEKRTEKNLFIKKKKFRQKDSLDRFRKEF